MLSRLAARRSGWNAADIRGEVEQLIARRNVVIDGPIRGELAEDWTARTLAHCVPLTDRPGVPEHIRALTSRDVLDVEADLTERLAARANAPASVCEARGVDTVTGLDDQATTPSVADPPCTTRTIRAVHDGTLLHLLERNRPHQKRPP